MKKALAKPVLKTVQRPGENGFKYQQKYGLVVVCNDEAHQQALFARLARLTPKLTLKVVCV
jgi:hypothetical protein